jgi:TnpA family transposase
MARQRLLGEAARARLLGLPADEREVLRHATLGPEDLALVAQHRGQPNQLGFALILVCLRYPARVLEANEVPPPGFCQHSRQAPFWRNLVTNYPFGAQATAK